MASPLTDKAFLRLLDDRLEKCFTGGFDEIADVRGNFFNVVTGKKAWLEYWEVSDVPDPEQFEGIINYQDIYPGYHYKIEPKEFAGGIMIQRRLIDTDRYDVIEERADGLGRAMKRLQNKHAHHPFIYMSSTAHDFLTAEEGVALCSNSHTTKSNASTTTGFDNLSTLPFNPTNLEAVRVQANQFKTPIGELFEADFDAIVHPLNLSQDVWEVMNSQGKVGEMTNDANFQRDKWSAYELKLWDQYDTNNWAIVDKGRMKRRGLVWYDSIKPEFSSTTDFDTMIRKYASYGVWGWGWVDWRWICGSVVS